MVTVTRDEGYNFTLYLDGLYESSKIALGSIERAKQLYVGRSFQPHDEYFVGSIDDVRIYEGALTASEVYELFLAQ